MNLNIRHLPWKSIRRLVYQFRKQIFVEEVDPETPPYLASTTDVDAIRSELAGVVPVDGEPWSGFGFTNGWEISYHYKDEDLNMRIPIHVPGGRPGDSEDREYYQLHVRGWKMDGGEVVLNMHVELEPTEYPRGHLRGDHLSEPAAFDLFEREIAPWTEIEGEIHREDGTVVRIRDRDATDDGEDTGDDGGSGNHLTTTGAVAKRRATSDGGVTSDDGDSGEATGDE